MSAHDPPSGTNHPVLRELRATGAPVIRLARPGPWHGALTAMEAEVTAEPHFASLLKSCYQEAWQPTIYLNQSIVQ